MKKFKRILAVILSAAMIVGTLAACSSTGTTDPTKAPDPTKASSQETVAPGNDPTEAPVKVPDFGDKGKTLNIYTWNTEWLERFVDYYPYLTFPDGETKTADRVAAATKADSKVKIGDVTVRFITVPNEGNAYQDNLDKVMEENGAGQEDADEEDIVDIFLIEADYALKYVDSDYTASMKDIGLDDSVFAAQYKYTKDVVTDSNGKLKGSSWQAAPGALIYRADIAEEILGAKTPDEVQAFVKDWDTFYATAETLAGKGIHMTSSVDDYYRVFSNNVSSKWVIDGKVNVDPAIKNWVDLAKKMYDNNMCTAEGLWGAAWNNGFLVNGDPKVFAFFGPAWLIDFCMGAGSEGTVATAGGWRVTPGPQGFFWGGTWVCAANGTDNAGLVADIIKTMTTDEGILTKIIEEKHDYVNNDALVQKYASDAAFGDPVMGGQNPLSVFSKGVSTIDLGNISAYDQGCNENFMNAIHDYCKGTYATYEEALKAFYDKIKTVYPELTIPE